MSCRREERKQVANQAALGGYIGDIRYIVVVVMHFAIGDCRVGMPLIEVTSLTDFLSISLIDKTVFQRLAGVRQSGH